MLVAHLVRLAERGRAVADGVGVGGAHVRHLDGQVDHPVAVRGDVLGDAAPACTGPTSTKRAEPLRST